MIRKHQIFIALVDGLNVVDREGNCNKTAVGTYKGTREYFIIYIIMYIADYANGIILYS